MATAEVNMGEAIGGLTLECVITGAKRARLRLRIGTLVMMLAARIIGCRVEVSMEPTDAEVIRYQPLQGGPERVVYGRRIRGDGNLPPA